jgi:murein DD-endopeptidase MepM/ murein hydrolase activator NlpD
MAASATSIDLTTGTATVGPSAGQSIGHQSVEQRTAEQRVATQQTAGQPSTEQPIAARAAEQRVATQQTAEQRIAAQAAAQQAGEHQTAAQRADGQRVATRQAAGKPAVGPAGQVTAAHPFTPLTVAVPPGDDAPAKQFPLGSLAADESATPTGVAVLRKKRPPVTAKTSATASARAGHGVSGWVHPIASASVTSCFGPRWGRLHAGVDLAASHGTPIVAAGAGVVVAAGAEGGYGNAVLIRHDNGYLTHYGHMSAILVTTGQQVRPGSTIGLEGSTGHSTGPHLHFEVHEGHYKNPVEPTAWMRSHGVELGGCA